MNLLHYEIVSSVSSHEDGVQIDTVYDIVKAKVPCVSRETFNEHFTDLVRGCFLREQCSQFFVGDVSFDEAVCCN